MPSWIERWLSFGLLCLMVVMWPAQARAADEESPSLAPPGPAASESVYDAHVQAQLVSKVEGVRPGETLTVALRLQMDEHWHTYWQNPGDSGMVTRLSWDLPKGFEAGEILWPAPHYYELAGMATYGYGGEILLPVRIEVPAELSADRVTLLVEASWLACREACVPGEANLSLSLPVVSDDPPVAKRWASLFEAAKAARAEAVSPDRVSVQTTQRGFELSLRDVGGPVDKAYFFAADSGMIEPAAEQAKRLEQQTLHLSLKRSALAEPEVERLRGVLALHRGDQRQTWRIDTAVERSEPAAASETTGEAGSSVASEDATPAGAAADDKASAAPTAAATGPGPQRLPLGQALLYAFIGGLLLNLMPCVFPVLSIKVMGFAQQAGEDHTAIRLHGLTFAGGVLVSFLALAGLLIGLRAGGEQIGWGFHLQNPVFVGVMALLLLAVGLNFSGLFEVGFGLMQAAGKAEMQAQQASGGGLGGSFSSGVLATAVATPCAAPLMGAAVGAALAMPAAASLLVFGVLGLGMASPYVVLSFFPGWTNLLPRPGAWMETLKQFLAFPMYGAAIWLAWVFGQQAGGQHGMMLLLSGGAVLALGLWAFGRFGQPGRSLSARVAGRTVAVACAVLAVGVTVWASSTFGRLAPPAAEGTVQAANGSGAGSTAASSSSDAPSITWVPYDEARIEAALEAGRPVFVDFTADWCLVCKVNEGTVLASETIRRTFRKHDVLAMKADWTNRDERITKALARFGYSSVPLYVVHSPVQGRDPQVFSSVLSVGQVRKAVQRAAASDGKALALWR